jgi:hypothetical protein
LIMFAAAIIVRPAWLIFGIPLLIGLILRLINKNTQISQ